jgi:hypothetical protein
VKANQSTVTDFGAKAPADIKAQADILVNAANAAVASNDGSQFATSAAAAAGAAVNTYCNQLNDGEAIPAYANAGKGTQICTDQAAIDQAIQGATDAASLLTALKSVQTRIDDFASNIPAAINTEATALVTAARAAIAANDPSGLETPAVQSDSLKVDSYCGITNSGPSGSTSTTA